MLGGIGMVHGLLGNAGLLLLLSTLLITSSGLVHVVEAAPKGRDKVDARQYATRMLDSILANGGDASGGATSQIELGVFQEALRQSISASLGTDLALTRTYAAALETSIASSNVTQFTNVTQDLYQPLDRLSIGRSLLVQQLVTRNPTTRSQIAALQESVNQQPRNDNGGLWYYNNINNLAAYHNLSYLDGMYSYAPFTTLLPTSLPSFPADQAFDEVSTQLDILYHTCHEPSTGLLVHGYDASKSHTWADPKTGASPIVWSRSLGWYTVGLVDSLDITRGLYPRHLRGKGSSFELQRAHLNQLAEAQITAVENTAKATGHNALYQVVTEPGAEGNFVESSGTALIAYALAKGARTGLLQTPDLRERAARTAGNMLGDLVENFVIENRNGTLSFNGTSAVASLSAATLDFDYYTTRPIVLNSLIGTSAFVLAALGVASL